MKTIRIDDETAHRLRIFIASENAGKVYGKTGIITAIAINQYVDRKEKYIDDLAKNALGLLRGQNETPQ